MSKRRDVFLETRPDRPRQCPACLTRVDAATHIGLVAESVRPRAVGLLTVCAYCRTLLVYTRHNLRLATADELDHVDPELRRIVEAYMREGVPRA